MHLYHARVWAECQASIDHRLGCKARVLLEKKGPWWPPSLGGAMDMMMPNENARTTDYGTRGVGTCVLRISLAQAPTEDAAEPGHRWRRDCAPLHTFATSHFRSRWRSVYHRGHAITI